MLIEDNKATKVLRTTVTTSNDVKRQVSGRYYTIHNNQNELTKKTIMNDKIHNMFYGG